MRKQITDWPFPPAQVNGEGEHLIEKRRGTRKATASLDMPSAEGVKAITLAAYGIAPRSSHNIQFKCAKNALSGRLPFD